MTAPSTLSKCAVTVDVPGTTLPSNGGAGTINVQTERECQWTAQPDVSWLSITAGSSGQGSGAVQFNVTANADPAARTGSVMVNGQRAQVAQAAGECRIDLSSNAASIPQTGGTGSVEVHASSALCTWTAVSDVNWISINSSANGKGSATVSFTAAATTGPPRAGTLTIAGLHFSVTQSEGCTYSVSPATYATGAAGGSQLVTVTAGAGCPWTASSNANWITVGTAAGSGPGTVTVNVAPTNGPTRTGTLTIAGQLVTVTQGEGCTATISPDSQSVAAAGGTGTVAVTAGDGCAWTATSSVSWITIAAGASGNGNGSVSFSVAATNGPGRSATLTIAGHTFTINQGQGCTFSLSATSTSAPATGSSGSFDVRSPDGCGWAANSSVNWLTVTAGATGTGNGTVQYNVAANPGPQRSGTMTAGGQTFTVTQSAGCSYSIAPASQNLASGGGSVSVAVTAPAGCSWNASSNDGWIAISSGTSGSGNGTVQITVAANADAERRGTATIADQTFAVVQASGCTYSLSPTSQTFPSGGGNGSFAVNTTGSCSWTPDPSASWIAITSAPNGTGPGTVQFTVAANSGGARTGGITAGAQTFSITQNSGCSPTVNPDTIPTQSVAGSLNVTVTAAPNCPWTSISNTAWIAIGMGASGSGNGTVRLDIQANTAAARSGTATVAGHLVTVNQDSGCTISIAPSSQSMPAGGGPGSVSVTAGGGCTWTAVGNATWIVVTGGSSGSGDGRVTFNVQANMTGAARTGSITIGGHQFTVNQAK